MAKRRSFNTTEENTSTEVTPVEVTESVEEVIETSTLTEPTEVIETPIDTVEPEQVKEEIPAVTVEPEQVEEDKKSDPVNEVKAILAEPLPLEEKLSKIKSLGYTGYTTLIAKLEGYNDIMNPKGVGVTAKVGAGKNYDLYTTIKSVVNSPEFGAFKIKFDIINLMFKANSAGSFSKHNLQRYDLEWTWGSKSLATYQSLAHLISTLADKATRESMLKTKVSLNNALNKDMVELNDNSIEFIKRYYQM